VLDNFSASLPVGMDEFAGNPRFDVVEGDVCDPRQVRRVMTDLRPEGVVHLAGLVSVMRSLEEPGESWRQNVQATGLVARLAESAGCRRFVFASSAAVYADAADLPLREDGVFPPALSPYGAHKAEAERLLLATQGPGMQRILLRYFNVYGVGQSADSPYSGVITRFLDRIRLGLPLQVFGDGDQSRDFIHVGDVARANMHAAMEEMPSGIYNVCSGTGISINTLVALLRERLPGLAVNAMPARDGEIQHSLGCSRKLASILGGWAPVAFLDGLADLLPAQSLDVCGQIESNDVHRRLCAG
jgi:UDP-glucose 4-epimerase